MELTDKEECIYSFHLKVNLDEKQTSKTEDGFKKQTTSNKQGRFQIQNANCY